MPNPISDALTLGPNPIVGSGASTQSTSRLDRSIFGRLLWKDWMVVKQVVMAIAIIIPVIQALMVLLSKVTNEDSSGLAGATVSMAVLSPTLIALGCSGMLIGHERQTGTWGWSSSLPTSWLSALISKLVVTICACVGVFFLTAAIPAILFVNGVFPTPPNDFRLVYVSFIMVLVWFEIIVFFNLASLLFREPIVALLVGAFAVSVAQLMVVGAMAQLSASFLHSVGLLGSRDEIELVLSVGLGFIFFVVAFFGMVWTFRWRWQYGQSVPLTSWLTKVRSKRVPVIEYRIRDTDSASEWIAQLDLALRNALGIRILLLVVLWMSVVWLNLSGVTSFIAPLIYVAIGILGATTFAGDQNVGRFRFLTDRGASLIKLVTSRLLMPAGLAIAVYAVCWFSLHYESLAPKVDPWTFLTPSILFLAFSIGVLGSLCFRRPIIAVTVTIFAVNPFWLLHQQASIVPVIFGGVFEWIIPNFYTAFFTCFSVVLIVVVYRIAYTWIVRDRVNLGIRFLAAFPIAAIIATLVLIHIGFLLQRNYDPKQFPLSAFEADLRKIPAIDEGPALFKAIDTSNWIPDIQLESLALFGQKHEQHRDAFNANVQKFKGLEANSEDWIDEARVDLGELENRLSQPAASPGRFDQQMDQQISYWNRLVAQLAILGRLSAAEGEFEISRHAWERARQILDTDSITMSSVLAHGRSIIWWSLTELTDSEIEGLGGPTAVRELCPILVPNVRYKEYFRLRMIRALAYLSGELSSNKFFENHDRLQLPWYLYYPPVRWAYMRAIVRITETQDYVHVPIEDTAKAREFLARLDRLQVASDRTDQSDQTDSD